MDQKYAQIIRAAVESYFQRNLTQQKSSEIMGVSRFTVSRLLGEAKKQGLVEIKTYPHFFSSHLSEILHKKLNLKDL